MAESRGAGNFLTVDEGVRPRANSDPTAGAWFKPPNMMLPEITIEDCTDNELFEINSVHDEGGLFGMDATPRRRANTCPEDLFRKRNGRPPTPPPGMFRRGSRFKSGFTKPLLRESVSFVHHRLSKLTEDTSEVHSQASQPAAIDRLACEQQTIVSQPTTESAPTPENQPATPTDDSPSVIDTASRGVSSGQTAKAAAGRQNNDGLSESGKAFRENRADDGSSDSEGSGSDSHYRAKSSVDCRYSRMTKPRGLDGAQLQAC